MVENTYNGDGRRVIKTVNGASTYYLYEYDKVILYKFVMPENLPGLHQAQINKIIAQGPDLLTPSDVIEINPR